MIQIQIPLTQIPLTQIPLTQIPLLTKNSEHISISEHSNIPGASRPLEPGEGSREGFLPPRGLAAGNFQKFTSLHFTWFKSRSSQVQDQDQVKIKSRSSQVQDQDQVKIKSSSSSSQDQVKIKSRSSQVLLEKNQL